MSWSFLTRLLDEISNHSTFVGKIWLTLLIVFRIVLTAVGGESIYYDEQSKFVIMITTPTILYLGFAMHKIARMDDDEYKPRGKRMPMVSLGTNRNYEEAEDNGEEDPMISEEIELEKKEKPSKKHDGRRRIKRDGLMKVYVFQLLSRAAFEVSPSYVCMRSPCPHTVDCFVSRPTEKTIFLFIMYAVSALCLLFTVLEILHLGYSGIRDCFCRPRPRPPTPHQLASQHPSQCGRQVPTAPPGYNTVLKKDPKGMRLDYNLGDSGRESFGDEASQRELERLRRHLKLAQQHLDLAYQNEDNSSTSRSNSPESNGTAVEQNRLNFAQEKQSSTCEKGLRA
ncbi:unnamed protein product [Oncorhynchus mykiss]|uniref:Gap junction protein n=1 Tax=Oncorhynchus mykiss TaxID=8022 RepID=A0A060VR11_ONCMY|nr:unnamed protein product [Oncorhynchus mykiss]